MSKSKAFTIAELMVAVLILTILVSLASVSYQRYRDRAAMLVDETNEKIILAAVKLYAYDTNALPGTLSQLRNDDLKRAYALVTNGKQPYTVLAFLREQMGLLDITEAFAVGPLDKYLGGPQATQAQIWKVLTCPMDSTPPSAGGVSYGITGGINGAANKPLSWLLNPANTGATIIMESDIANPTDLDGARRHEGRRTFVKALASGAVVHDRDDNGDGPGH